MTVFPEPVFSERKFPGIVTWLSLFFLTSWLGIGLSSLAGRPSDGRWGALTELFLVQPLFRLCLAVICIGILARALRVSLPAILQGITPWLLPLQLLPGLIDLLLRVLGIPVPQPFYLNGVTVPLSFLTAGLAPYPLASYGILATILCMTALSIRLLRRSDFSWLRAVGTGGFLYLGAMFLLAFSSFLGWMGLTTQARFLDAGSNLVGRGLIILSQEGYWWTKVYERFPGTLGGEAEVSVMYLLAVCAYLSLCVVAVYWIFRVLRLSYRVWFFGERLWLFLQFALVLVSGALLGIIHEASWSLSLVTVLAMLVFLCTWISALLAMLGEGDLADLSEDERANLQRPLIQGAVAVPALLEASTLMTGFALIGGWLLGWPVFLSVALFLIAQATYRSSLLQGKMLFPLNHVLLGFAWLMIWVSGWFFLMQEAEIARLSLPLLMGMGLFFASQTIWRSWQRYEQSGGGSFQGVVTRWGQGRAKWIMAGLVGGGYLIPALFVRSWFWFCFSAAIGFATVLILLSKKPRLLELRGLFAIFLLVSLFILGR